MESSETLSRLCYHAGLEENLSANVMSLADALWEHVSAEESFEDVLEALENLNTEINGVHPSEHVQYQTHLSRRLVYAVHEIILLIRHLSDKDVGKKMTEIKTMAWQLEVAWSAILSGDIDNIKDHIIAEKKARDM